MSTNYERRIASLEGSIGMTWTSDVLEMAERIASEEGVPVDELVDSVNETIRAIGPPFTVERMAAYYAKRDGIPIDESLDLVRRAMEKCA